MKLQRILLICALIVGYHWRLTPLGFLISTSRVSSYCSCSFTSFRWH
jgi:hypothetical protein